MNLWTIPLDLTHVDVLNFEKKMRMLIETSSMVAAHQPDICD